MGTEEILAHTQVRRGQQHSAPGAAGGGASSVPHAGGGSSLGGRGLAGILGCCLGAEGTWGWGGRLGSWFSARVTPSLGFPGVPSNRAH